jgi:HPt (histidine-containing phosphotransfer) domain-containing protein
MNESKEKPAQPDLTAALDRLWARFLPEIRERVAVIDAAVAALAAGSLSPGQKDDAASAAHKLAGVLGTFSLARGTELARELELRFSGSPGSADQLASIAAELRAVIDSRG